MSLRVEGARKAFRAGGVVALDGVDIATEDELLVIVGPSGSGKSTLLRAIAGLEPLDAGRVLIGDRDVTSLPPAARDVAMVFQEAAVFPHLTVAANIGIGERARGAGRRSIEARVREVAGVLDVDHLLDRMPGELSGGERQRVALARAMIRVPAVCLLDEPLASVDAESRLRMRGEIRALQRSLGVPMVHVTHDQLEALAMADRVAVMHGGRVLQCDTPTALYARPATTAVARIVGPLPMNLLASEGRVVGVRPERIRLGGDGLRATVLAVEQAGEECLVRLEAPVEVVEGDLLARLPWTAAPEAGTSVTVTWRTEDEHHFDATTGNRR
ncbi:ABC transporter ATP-binding protein [Actinokineospora fastidiosa]|uniref:Sugar ABC transporter ATP-binding protein n=1 Tax=Actinokineospora fastidiosa TaxID=1816 RepID=A0A918GDV3_9PSEU|nr:ABC transporter ATP-binding protein [Actinokineospora fastidiosa]GGS30475.1 sugar ABC transporter ATP-binding protein [Actinokineospora fastidiosa]